MKPPAYGDRRDGACTWCRRPVVEVYAPYPRHTGIKGGFWDGGACPCGGEAGMIAMADSKLHFVGRDRVRPRGWHRSVPVPVAVDFRGRT